MVIFRSLLSATLLTFTLAANAAERITRFHSDIAIAKDASMEVVETISVIATGQQIRRGIYRDFPTDYKDRFGNSYNVTFEVEGVKHNGRAEAWHVERRFNGVRVYMGRADTRVAPGPHEYTLKYRTSWQLGFFAEHDELYWNVTGNDWGFAIDVASATVQLPQAVDPQLLSVEGFVGKFGSNEKSITTQITSGTFNISSTRVLAPREGLTLVATWPKGIVAEPTAWDRFVFLLSNNLGLLIALTTLLGIGGYLYWQWHRVGRDPQPGPIFAHYEPPSGYSPASVRYISKMGYDNAAFSAAIVNLAVKGHLLISNSDDTYTLVRKESPATLAPGEAVLAAKLFSSGDTLVLKDDQHQRVAGAISAHKRAIARDYANKYFLTNAAKLWPSLLALVLSAALIGFSAEFSAITVICLILAGILHLPAAYLMKAPTRKGRKLMDELEGFKLYLEVAEKDDLQRLRGPELTAELFERWLPFAMALGVEQAWAERFTEVFARLAAEPSQSSYRPAWYQGNFNHARLGLFASDVGSGFRSSIAAASTPPGSSSGSGGGGFSGGGGGGGGGGGW